MKYQDKVEVVYSKMLPAGSRFNHPVISEDNIPGLLKSLEEADIVIDQRNSEKDIEYSINGIMKRTGLVPFETQLPEHVKVGGYFLRNNGLEIVLGNFQNVTGGVKGRMGGSRTYKGGIAGVITYTGFDDGKQIIESAKEVIKTFFSGFDDGDPKIDLSKWKHYDGVEEFLKEKGFTS